LGVPVISSNSGGLSEVNFEGISGYLSDVGNTDEMAENALKILKDSTTLSKFKENALSVAKNENEKDINFLVVLLLKLDYQNLILIRSPTIRKIVLF
jgi:glycosyltransferase involved in cell wall biosynthesis